MVVNGLLVDQLFPLLLQIDPLLGPLVLGYQWARFLLTLSRIHYQCLDRLDPVDWTPGERFSQVKDEYKHNT